MTALSQPIIKLENVFAGYEDKVVLQDVSLEVLHHDFLGVIGPNGGGKTTLMRIILGMMKPFSGKVSYYRDGVEVPELTIGYLPQYNDIDRKFPIGALSGGQLQRVLLARAIVSRPEVVVLDEPNTYIDKRFQEQMYQMLDVINRDCAIIIVSHDVGTILQNVKAVACVNRTLHYHDTPQISNDELSEHFGCPIDLLGHGHMPHRVLKAHED